MPHPLFPKRNCVSWALNCAKMIYGRFLFLSSLIALGCSIVWSEDNPPVVETNPPPATHTSIPPTYRVWIWQENGDTLWRIAQKVYGDKDKWPLIYQANRDVIKDPNKIYPKQVLKIPPVDWQP